MQKWLPDAFLELPGAAIEAEDAGFQASRAAPQEEGAAQSQIFLSEKGFQNIGSTMSHLTPDERAQIFELVEQDLSRQYEVRAREMAQAQATELEITRQGFQQALDQWSRLLANAQAEYLKATAGEAARLAIQLAEKIIRDRVQEDRSVLVRGMETALFKLEGARATTVSVHPEEATWLETHPEVLERLGVGQVLADRRVDKGGCLVRTEHREWDATIKGQLSYLTELVEEMIATQDAPDLSIDPPLQESTDQNEKDDTDVAPSLD